MYPRREMYSTSNYSSTILFSPSLLVEVIKYETYIENARLLNKSNVTILSYFFCYYGHHHDRRGKTWWVGRKQGDIRKYLS